MPSINANKVKQHDGNAWLLLLTVGAAQEQLVKGVDEVGMSTKLRRSAGNIASGNRDESCLCPIPSPKPKG